MKILGRLYVNGKLVYYTHTANTLQLVSLKKGDLIDIVNLTHKTADEAEIDHAGIYHFGIKKDGTVFLIRGW